MRYRLFGGGEFLCPRCHGRDFHTLIEGQDSEGHWSATVTCDWCDAGVTGADVKPVSKNWRPARWIEDRLDWFRAVLRVC